MLLTIDIGNTSVSFGIFDGYELKSDFKILSERQKSAEKYASEIRENTKGLTINTCIVSSVAEEITGTLIEAVEKVFDITPMILNSKLKMNFSMNKNISSQAGADRLANASAAVKYCTLPAIVVDAGTATTFDIVNKMGEFSGGIIMPGVGIQLKSLNTNTSKLPKIEAKPIDKVIGADTAENILSGVIRGHACAINGLLKECETELGQKPFVVITGGYSEILSKYISYPHETNPKFTLQGLQVLYELNL